MTTTITTYNFPTAILHNTTTDEQGRHPAWVRGYAAGDTLEEVFTYGDWEQNPDKTYRTELVAAALRDAFDLANVLDDPYYADHPCHATAIRYRSRQVRSMCKGDAVKLGDRTFVADSYGWSELHVDGTTTKFL